MAMEIISYCKSKSYNGLVHKVDYDKSFDNVDWSFLIKLLLARGFGLRWCRWIVDLFFTAKASVLVNGSVGNSFKLRKGLK